MPNKKVLYDFAPVHDGGVVFFEIPKGKMFRKRESIKVSARKYFNKHGKKIKMELTENDEQTVLMVVIAVLD